MRRLSQCVNIYCSPDGFLPMGSPPDPRENSKLGDYSELCSSPGRNPWINYFQRGPASSTAPRKNALRRDRFIIIIAWCPRRGKCVLAGAEASPSRFCGETRHPLRFRLVRSQSISRGNLFEVDFHLNEVRYISGRRTFPRNFPENSRERVPLSIALPDR